MLLNDGSSKTLMVDERQSVRDVLDNLFEKTHCDCNVDWSLCETNAELHLGESRRGWGGGWRGKTQKKGKVETPARSEVWELIQGQSMLMSLQEAL